MSLRSSELELLQQHFQHHDPHGTGQVQRVVVCNALKALGCGSAERVLELSGFEEGDQVAYAEFLDWLMRGDNSYPTTPRKPKPTELAAPPQDELTPEKVQAPAHAAAESQQAQEPRASSKGQQGQEPRVSSKAIPLGFREQATELVERGGPPGALVDDLQEVDILDLPNKSAMACWRSCPGLRVYRSRTVTEALRLICSAPVPGLGSTSYLDVFEALTHSGWEHHIFLFGGLVRDILRRKVGNDIDITFSAPAAELEQICKQHGYKCTLEGDYILIGDANGEEYLEGMVVTHNGITPPENSDFSMNWVFYDFCNDIIIDKTGHAVEAVIANRCEIPCPRAKWDSWVAIGGSRVLFRYYKFLIRGYEYDDKEMSYIAERLLDFWFRDPEETIANGREALNALISSQDARKFERLRQLVFISFTMAGHKQVKPHSLTRQKSVDLGQGYNARQLPAHGRFLCASSWWSRGWLPMLTPF